MKKLVLVLLLLAPSAMAADFLDSFTAYRDHIRRKLGMTTTATSYLSDTTLNMFIREAAAFVGPVIRGPKKTYTFVTTFNQNTYTMDSLVSVLSVGWSYNDSAKEMVYVPRQQWYQMDHKTTAGKKGYELRPSYYDYTDDNLMLYPTPTKTTVDTIRVIGIQKVPNLAAAATLTAVPQQYRVPILNYAAYLAARSVLHAATETLWREFEFSLRAVDVSLNGRQARDTTR